MFRNIIVLMLALVMLVMGCSIPGSDALEMEPDGTGGLELTESTNTTNTTEDDSIIGTLKGAFTDIIDAFVGIIVIPFEVIIDVFSAWGQTLGTWWGPLLGGVVLFGLYLLIRFAFASDKFFDLFS